MRKHLALGALIVLALFLGSAVIANANPMYFGITSQTATATSTRTTLIPGVATSTLIYDAYAPTTKSTTYKTNQNALLIQFVGSTTSSVLGVAFEYSQDGSDWYSDSLFGPNAITGTSTQPLSLNTLNTLSLTYASTTQTLGGVGQGTIQRRIVMVPTPVRYVRAIFTATGATSTIWAQFVPSKELQ